MASPMTLWHFSLSEKAVRWKRYIWSAWCCWSVCLADNMLVLGMARLSSGSAHIHEDRRPSPGIGKMQIDVSSHLKPVWLLVTLQINRWNDLVLPRLRDVCSCCTIYKSPLESLEYSE